METEIKFDCYRSSKIKDLTGKTYLHFKVLNYAGFGKKHVHNWLCECECGKKFIATSTEINNEIIGSCGCAKKIVIKADEPRNWDEVDNTRISLIIGDNPKKNNKSGHKGIYVDNHGTWYAKLIFKGVTYRVRCDNELQAIYERKKLEIK